MCVVIAWLRKYAYSDPISGQTSYTFIIYTFIIHLLYIHLLYILYIYYIYYTFIHLLYILYIIYAYSDPISDQKSFTFISFKIGKLSNNGIISRRAFEQTQRSTRIVHNG
jgi:hypothetical protein